MYITRDYVEQAVLYPEDAFVDGHFGPFRWLGDTDDHGKWQAAYDFLFTFSLAIMAPPRLVFETLMT